MEKAGVHPLASEMALRKEPPPLSAALVTIKSVTLLEGAEEGPVPIALVAATVNVYAVPLVNPPTLMGDPDPLAKIAPGLEVTV